MAELARVPQDHKRSRAETAAEPFTFTHDGATFTLPRIKAGTLRRTAHIDDDEKRTWAILEEVADPAALDAIDDMDVGPGSEYETVMNAWNEHTGTSLGK